MGMKIERDLTEDSQGKLYYEPYPKKIAQLLSENVIFKFPEGVPAFEDARQFVIVINPKIKPFLYLQCLDVENLGFICIDPFLINRDYIVQVPAKDLSLLDLKDAANAFVLTLVTVEKDPKETTTNLLAPIVLNMDTLVGRQVIMEEEHPVQYRIWDALENLEQTGSN